MRLAGWPSTALEDIGDVAVWLDAPVELGGFDQRADSGPAPGTTIGAGEQMILASQRDRPDGAFYRVGVELDASVVEELAEARPAGQSIVDGRSPQARKSSFRLNDKMKSVLHRSVG